MSRKDEGIRRKRYAKLREAGFTSKEATRLKDKTDETIDRLVCIKLEYESRKRTLFSELNESITECLKTASVDDNEIKAVLNNETDES